MTALARFPRSAATPGTLREILEAALELEPDERELLLEELSASLRSGFASDELESAWMDELNRRSREIDDGTVDFLDRSDVKQRIAGRRAGTPR